ncbi:MAG: hypothetical protein JW718_10000 [Desulfovibrionaceae bacterium]|nr:hypothetical protein [Desulfovibrionaceae bacterium]
MVFSNLLLILFSITELVLLGVVIFFFLKLKKSEGLLLKIQANQDDFINKLRFNAQIEQELIQTFELRQEELMKLNEALEQKSRELKRLLDQAHEYSRSPQFLRQIILAGHARGESPQDLARATGLSVDEVEIIIDRS